MIKLTRMNGSELYVNPDLIETIEETPDTHLTLANGHKYLVLESAAAVIEKIILFRAKVMRRAAVAPVRKYLLKRQRDAFRLCCMLED
jgi:flagellar protein FlbD